MTEIDVGRVGVNGLRGLESPSPALSLPSPLSYAPPWLGVAADTSPCTRCSGGRGDGVMVRPSPLSPEHTDHCSGWSAGGGGVYAPWISVISVIQRSRTCRGVTVMAIDSENRCEMPNNSAALPILEL